MNDITTGKLLSELEDALAGVADVAETKQGSRKGWYERYVDWAEAMSLCRMMQKRAEELNLLGQSWAYKSPEGHLFDAIVEIMPDLANELRISGVDIDSGRISFAELQQPLQRAFETTNLHVQHLEAEYNPEQEPQESFYGPIYHEAYMVLANIIGSLDG